MHRSSKQIQARSFDLFEIVSDNIFPSSLARGFWFSLLPIAERTENPRLARMRFSDMQVIMKYCYIIIWEVDNGDLIQKT
jgi:hypothetical protein